MSAERVPENGRVLRLAASGPEDAISAWLGVLVRLLRVPAGEAEGIREELESHLRERVRDLEVGGMGEDEAVRCAVSELGDAAALAQRYREARAFPRRRLMMNLSMLAMAGAAVAVGVVALSQPGGVSHVSVFEPPQPTAEEHAALTRKIEAKYENVPLTDVLAHASHAIGMPITVVWRPIEEKGIARETPVTLAEKVADFPMIVRALSDQLGESTDWSLDFRVVDGTVRVATEEYFDRREVLLASYDMSVFGGAVSGEEVTQLIEKFVHPTGWENAGGTLARLHLVGNKMFVEAPKRFHAEIKWFIEELSKEPGRAATDRGVQDRDRAVLVEQAAAARKLGDKKAAQDAARATDEAARVTEVLRAQHASAAELVAILHNLQAASPAAKVSMSADPRTNSIVLSGSQSDLAAVRDLMTQLDSKAATERAMADEKVQLQAQVRDLEQQLTRVRQEMLNREAERRPPDADRVNPPARDK